MITITLFLVFSLVFSLLNLYYREQKIIIYKKEQESAEKHGVTDIYHIGDRRLQQRTKNQNVGADVSVKRLTQSLLATSKIALFISTSAVFSPFVSFQTASPPVVGVPSGQDPLILGTEHAQRRRLNTSTTRSAAAKNALHNDLYMHKSAVNR